MQTQKIKFNDIKGMLSRDEMKEIIGGCGSGSGSGSDPFSTGGGGITLPTVTVYGSYNTGSNYGAISAALSYYGGGYSGSSGSTGTTYYGGGGGGSTAATSQPGPHSLPTANLPKGDGTNKQAYSTCVFRSMEVVEKYLGKSFTLQNFTLDYCNKFGKTLGDALLNGFVGNTTDLANFINSEFIATACTSQASMINAISTNQIIMASIRNTAYPDAGHEVTIVGYDPAKGFSYYDSMTDTYNWTNGQTTEFSNAYIIAGVGATQQGGH